MRSNKGPFTSDKFGLSYILITPLMLAVVNERILINNQSRHVMRKKTLIISGEYSAKIKFSPELEDILCQRQVEFYFIQCQASLMKRFGDEFYRPDQHLVSSNESNKKCG